MIPEIKNLSIVYFAFVECKIFSLGQDGVAKVQKTGSGAKCANWKAICWSGVKAVEQGVLHEEDSDEDRSRKYLLTIYFIFTVPTDGRQVP